MKEKTIQIKTMRSLQEISTLLRTVGDKLKANIDKASPDPLSLVEPSISIRYSGKNFGIGPREWCVVVFVTEYDSYREVKLTAMGDDIGKKIFSGFSMYRGEASSFYQIEDSIERRNYIANLIK